MMRLRIHLLFAAMIAIYGTSSAYGQKPKAPAEKSEEKPDDKSAEKPGKK